MWVAAALAPCAMRPDFTTTTGLMRAAARAADMNLRASLIGFDVEQNGARLSIEREVIQEIGDIDVELIADRYDAGKADRALRRPFDHAGGDGAGLRDQRQIALAGHMRGKLALRLTPGTMRCRGSSVRSAACRISARSRSGRIRQRS